MYVWHSSSSRIRIKKIKTGHRGCQLNNTDKCPRSRNYLKFTHGSLRLNTATLSLLTTRADNRFQTLMLRQTKALFYRTLWAYYNCDTSTIRVRFDYDSTTIRLRYNILRGVMCLRAIMNMSILSRCCRML